MTHPSNLGPETIPYREVMFQVKTLMRAAVQRKIKAKTVMKITAGFRYEALGIIVLSERGDGKVYVLDGQHRLRAMHDLGKDDEFVKCHVYTGLTKEQEAEIVKLCSLRAGKEPGEEWMLDLERGDETICAADALIREIGFRAQWDVDGTEDGNIRAFTKLREIYAGRGKSSGPKALRWVLIAIRHAYGVEEGPDRYVLTGIHLFYAKYAGLPQFDYPHFIDALKSLATTPAGLTAAGKRRAPGLGSDRRYASGIRQAVLEEYNKGKRRRKDRLPDPYSDAID
jgi:hypothetical protein